MDDRVKLVQDERLDIVDANRLQTMVYEYAAQALAGIIGLGNGVLTRPVATTVFDAIGIRQTTFSKFFMVQATAGMAEFGAGAAGAGNDVLESDLTALVYDPADPNQTFDKLSPQAYAANEDTPSLWARWVEADTDVDTRRKWSVGDVAEIAFATETKVRKVIHFELNKGKPNDQGDGGPWFRIGKIHSWEGVAPVKQPRYTFFSPFDVQNLATGPQTQDGQQDDSAAVYFERGQDVGLDLTEFDTKAGQRPVWSLRHLLTGIIQNFRYIHNLSVPHTDPDAIAFGLPTWYLPGQSLSSHLGSPDFQNRGLVQINMAIDKLNKAMAKAENQLNALAFQDSSLYIHSAGKVTWTGTKDFSNEGGPSGGYVLTSHASSTGMSTIKSGAGGESGTYSSIISFSCGAHPGRAGIGQDGTPEDAFGIDKFAANIVQVIVTPLANEAAGTKQYPDGPFGAEDVHNTYGSQVNYINRHISATGGATNFQIRTFRYFPHKSDSTLMYTVNENFSYEFCVLARIDAGETGFGQDPFDDSPIGFLGEY